MVGACSRLVDVTKKARHITKPMMKPTQPNNKGNRLAFRTRISQYLTADARNRSKAPPNARTERRGRPSASALETDVARPRSLQ